MTENLKRLHVLLHTNLKIVFAVVKMAEKYKSCCVVVVKLTFLYSREQMLDLYCSRQRRSFKRGLKRKHNGLLARLRKVRFARY